MKTQEKTSLGTLRISKDLQVYEKTKNSWKKSSKTLPQAMQVIKLFKAHKNFKLLLDKKNPKFIKGQLSPEGKCQGSRINILPDGQVLDKAYSLFAKNLTIHDESSHSHWDLIYQNPNGKFAYLYTLEKRKSYIIKKYQAVKEFEKSYPLLTKKITSSLSDKEDNMALPMYTLLKTYMRVGNEIYYKQHKHKGLTTLKKNDISIKGQEVTFNYLAKDGVPIKTTSKFHPLYIKRLKETLKPLKKSEFVFTNPLTHHPLQDKQFKEEFLKCCGKEFYPHIVRSYYATKKAKEFISSHKSASKQQVQELFLSIAEKLGHRRFNKKDHTWEENYNVTIHHYIQPELVDKIKSLVQ
ncbi:MAG: hypothetical protein ABIH72_04545 [archaeon]